MCGFREAVFVLRFESSENQLRQQFQTAHVTVIEAEGFRRERLQQPDHTPSSAQWNSNHGPRAQLAARVQIYSLISLGVITADNLCCAKTRSRECRIALDARAYVRFDGAR